MLRSMAIVFLQPQRNPLREVRYIDEVYTVETETVVWFSHKAAEVFSYFEVEIKLHNTHVIQQVK